MTSLFAWRPRKATKRIIVHSSHFEAGGDDHTGLMRARGREMGLLEVGYHFVIERSGRLVECRPREVIGSHTPGHNHESVGVCLAGRFEHTPEQVEALLALIVSLFWDFGRLQVVGHTELQRYRGRDLVCPALDMPALRDRVETLLSYQEIPVNPTEPAPAQRLTPQQQLILDYLGAGRTLTTKVAITSLGIMSVSSRVAELRAMGHKITDYTATDHFERQYKKYLLVGAGGEPALG